MLMHHTVRQCVRSEAMQCLQQQPSSVILHPDASKGSEYAAVKSMLQQGNVVCLYTSALEQVIVNRNTGELVFHSPLLTGSKKFLEYMQPIIYIIAAQPATTVTCGVYCRH